MTAIMQRQTAAVLYLTLEDAAGETSVLGVTAEHPLYDATAGWTEAGDLVAGEIVLDAMLAPLTVLALRVDDTPQLVHNLEVGGTHTYFAREMAAWAHNARNASQYFANSLCEQLALDEIMSEPSAGRFIKFLTSNNPNGDPQDGISKFSNRGGPNGRRCGPEIHFVINPKNGIAGDFRFIR